MLKQCLEDLDSQRAVAARFRISPQLVSSIVREHTKEPHIIKKRQHKVERRDVRAAAISDVASHLLRKAVPVVNAGQVQEEVEKKYDLRTTKHQVHSVFKE